MPAFALMAWLPISYGHRGNAGLNRDLAPTGKGVGTLYNPGKAGDHFGAPASRITSYNGISYHGGPVMLGTTNVYLIWYGNWSGNSATTILTDLVTNIGGSTYFNINTTYYNGSNVHVSNSVKYAGSINDSYSRGTSLSDSDIQTIVSTAITNGLPKETNA